MIELPAGYMDDGEKPLAAAQRELREETGFTAESWHKLGVFYKNSAKTRGDNVHLFLALDAKKTVEQDLDENENIEVIVKPFKEIFEMARQGEIKGSDSALAIMLAERKLSSVLKGE